MTPWVFHPADRVAAWRRYILIQANIFYGKRLLRETPEKNLQFSRNDNLQRSLLLCHYAWRSRSSLQPILLTPFNSNQHPISRPTGKYSGFSKFHVQKSFMFLVHMGLHDQWRIHRKKNLLAQLHVPSSPICFSRFLFFLVCIQFFLFVVSFLFSSKNAWIVFSKSWIFFSNIQTIFKIHELFHNSGTFFQICELLKIHVHFLKCVKNNNFMNIFAILWTFEKPLTIL